MDLWRWSEEVEGQSRPSWHTNHRYENGQLNEKGHTDGIVIMLFELFLKLFLLFIELGGYFRVVEGSIPDDL